MKLISYLIIFVLIAAVAIMWLLEMPVEEAILVRNRYI